MADDKEARKAQWKDRTDEARTHPDTAPVFASVQRILAQVRGKYPQVEVVEVIDRNPVLPEALIFVAGWRADGQEFAVHTWLERSRVGAFQVDPSKEGIIADAIIRQIEGVRQ